MDKKNIFAIALCLSLVWHFLGGQAVHIIWPEKLAKRSFPEINFWGSFLQGNTFKNINIDLKNNPQTEDGEQLDAEGVKEVDFNAIEKETLPLSELSDKQEHSLSLDRQENEEFQVSESVSPDLKRAILVKPDLPVYPEWAKQLGSYFEMELKVLISADGTVLAVEKIKSAGYPEIDEIGIRYIRQWKFMPLPEGSEETEQWGVVKLVFNLK